MKTVIKVEKEVSIKYVKMDIAVRYDDEDIPYDFPLRNGDMWSAIVDVDKGIIQDWPKGKSGHLYMKVCDEGSYFLLDEDGNTIFSIEGNYVPNELIPGQYGDYVDLHIDENGIIMNWYSKPNFEDFIVEEY